jgi:hypothetical protein
VEYHSEGALPAAYIKAKNPSAPDQPKEGWVTCGSFTFPYIALELDASRSVVMPQPEAKRFSSVMRLAAPKDGGGMRIEEKIIEVNSPITFEGWDIYQMGYDEAMGKWSRRSLLELVRDPWRPAVYTGIFMLLAGAVCMFAGWGKY